MECSFLIPDLSTFLLHTLNCISPPSCGPEIVFLLQIYHQAAYAFYHNFRFFQQLKVKMRMFILFLFQNIDSDSLEQQQKQTRTPENLPVKVSAEKTQESRNLRCKQTSNCETLFPIFITHPSSMAGFVKFTVIQLLHIATESLKEGFSGDTYEEFVDEIKMRNPKLRIDI